MAKISMTQVLRVLWDSDPLRIARTEKKETVRLPYSEFERIMMEDDFIVTSQTMRRKWDLAVNDEIIVSSATPYTMGFVNIPNLAFRVGEPYDANVCVSCVRVCVSDAQKNGGSSQ